MRNIAVVTDAVSTGGWFPKWLDYYSRAVGRENIVVCCYSGLRENFRKHGLKFVKEIGFNYNNDVRCDALSSIVQNLLSIYDLVIRVDTDEFIVPNPEKFQNLKAYLQEFSGPYVTARGFEVFECPGESPINLQQEILRQRRACYALTAMNKTCITRTPLKWDRGFHFCSRPPVFGDLFLMHMKRADVRMQKSWAERMMASVTPNSFEWKYQKNNLEMVEKYNTGRSRMEFEQKYGIGVMIRDSWNAQFMESMVYKPHKDLFAGEFSIEKLNIEIPDVFKSFF